MINPFIQLYKPYFDFLKSHFQHLADETIKAKVGPGDIAREFLSIDRRKSAFAPLYQTMQKFIHEYWQSNGNAVFNSVMQLKGLKARFGGDIGPQIQDNIIQKAGLYFDTLIIPDPLYRITTMVAASEINPDYYLLKYAIAQTMMADIYLADVDPPIVVLLPDKYLVDVKANLPQLRSDCDIQTTLLINKLFGINLDRYSDVNTYLSKFSDIRNAVSAIQNPEMLWLDEYAPRDAASQIDSIIAHHYEHSQMLKIPYSPEDARYLSFVLYGRSMQSYDLFQSATELGATPLISAPVSFHWFRQRFSIEQSIITKELAISNNIDLIASNALLSERQDWLGNVPLDSLILLRQKGILRDLRTLLATNLSKFNDIAPATINEASKEIDSSISDALKKHQAELSTLNKSLLTDFSITVPTLISSIVAALQPTILSFLPIWSPLVATIAGSGSVAELLRKSVDYFKTRNTLKESPIGILWSARERK